MLTAFVAPEPDDWGFSAPATKKPVRATAPLQASASSDSTPMQSRVASPAPQTAAAGTMTKEEKAAEMARRKEERKQVCRTIVLV